MIRILVMSALPAVTTGARPALGRVLKSHDGEAESYCHICDPVQVLAER